MFNLLRKKKGGPCSYPHNTKLLWNKGIAMLCDRQNLDKEYKASIFNNLQPGEICWMRAGCLEQFVEQTLPQINAPFAIVTADSTLSMPRECCPKKALLLLENPNLLYWFAQNCDPGDLPADKVFPIPLGIDFHSQYEKKSWRYKVLKTPQEQERDLSERSILDPSQKILAAYADFQFNNTTRNLIKRDPKILKDRKTITKQLTRNPAVFFQKRRLVREKLWSEMAKYQFVISPHGTGLDCHRTWEALILGSYVIVETSVLDPLYAQLPVKILKDYAEISPEKLREWAQEFVSKYKYEEYSHILTNQYWVDKMRAMVQSKIRAKEQVA